MAGLCDRLDRSRHARPSRSVTTACVERDVYHADASRQRSQVDRACVDRSLTTRSRGILLTRTDAEARGHPVSRWVDQI